MCMILMTLYTYGAGVMVVNHAVSLVDIVCGVFNIQLVLVL